MMIDFAAVCTDRIGKGASAHSRQDDDEANKSIEERKRERERRLH